MKKIDTSPVRETGLKFSELSEDDQIRVCRAVIGFIRDFQLEQSHPLSVKDNRTIKFGTITVSLDPQMDGWVVWVGLSVGLGDRILLHAREVRTLKEALKLLLEYLPPERRKLNKELVSET